MPTGSEREQGTPSYSATAYSMARFAASPMIIRPLNFNSLVAAWPCRPSQKVQRSLNTKFETMETSMAMAPA